jgi:proton glutamate symport protein
MNKIKSSPLVVLMAIVAGILVGLWTGTESKIFGISSFSIYESIGKIFINSLMLVVVPLVCSSIISGIAKVGNDGSFGRLGLKTFSFYFGTSILAILIGLLCANLFHPGSFASSGYSLNGAEFDLDHVRQQVSLHEGVQFFEMLARLIPSNIFAALSSGEMLGVIFFCMIFGYSLSKVRQEYSDPVLRFWKGVFETMIEMTHFIMKFLPVGVFCLVAKTFASTGMVSLKPLLLFVVAVLVGLTIFSCGILPLLLKIIGGVSPIRHIKAMGPALLTAFSTSSTSASLPITMECVEKRAGVSERITSLVVPLGCSINLSGSALYECVAALFVAQVYGLHLGFFTQFFILVLSLLTSLGTAGIPSGSLVGVIIILKAMGLPTEGIGMIVAVDRLLDMCRTTVNAFSDSCCAVLVAKTEGEKTVLQPSNY